MQQLAADITMTFYVLTNCVDDDSVWLIRHWQAAASMHVWADRMDAEIVYTLPEGTGDERRERGGD